MEQVQDTMMVNREVLMMGNSTAPPHLPAERCHIVSVIVSPAPVERRPQRQRADDRQPGQQQGRRE